MSVVVGNNTSNTTVTNIGLTLAFRSTDPSNPTVGQMYFNTSNNTVKVYTGNNWILMSPLSQGVVSTYPITDISTFETTNPGAGTYWIKPPGASSAFACEYSGGNYRSTGYGFFRWWRAADQSTPTVNFYGNGYQWNLMAVEKESSSIYTIGFSSNQTFDSRSDTSTATSGTRSGYRVYFGQAGGHGIYNTGQGVCNWSTASGAIGAGYNGSCGSFPNGLVMGEGQSSTSVYNNTGGTWSFWFRW